MRRTVRVVRLEIEDAERARAGALHPPLHRTPRLEEAAAQDARLRALHLEHDALDDAAVRRARVGDRLRADLAALTDANGALLPLPEGRAAPSWARRSARFAR